MDQHPNGQNNDTRRHYENLLAEVYDWMQGGWEQRAAMSRELFARLGISPADSNARAVDLGAGTGYQSLPLAELGFAVTAIDSSPTMLAQLAQHKDRLKPAGSIETLEGDLTALDQHLTDPVQLIVCMGDTLAHLETHEQVADLFVQARRLLANGGQLILGFRDGSQPPAGDNRFIPVRSDDERIFTCFLEEIDDDRIRVHDVVHQRGGDGFVQTVSSYNKIRLSTDWVAEQLAAAGFTEPTRTTDAGMTILVSDARY